MVNDRKVSNKNKRRQKEKKRQREKKRKAKMLILLNRVVAKRGKKSTIIGKFSFFFKKIDFICEIDSS